MWYFLGASELPLLQGKDRASGVIGIPENSLTDCIGLQFLGSASIHLLGASQSFIRI